MSRLISTVSLITIMASFHLQSRRCSLESSNPKTSTVMGRVRDYFDRVEREYRHEQRDNYPHLNTAHQYRFEDESMMLLDDIKNTRIINDRNRFVIDIDAHRYRPDQIQIRTIIDDHMLIIECRQDDNDIINADENIYTKMHFTRKYLIPNDVDIESMTSTIDSKGRLIVNANKIVPSRRMTIGDPVTVASRHRPDHHDQQSTINESTNSNEQQRIRMEL